MRKNRKKLLGTMVISFTLCLTMLDMPGTALAERCVDNSDGTVTDNSAGLMWQKATAGPMNWDQAMSYASGLSLGGHSDWRLPSRYELEDLYDSPCKNMMDVREDYYWSSTTSDYVTDFVWRITFVDGYGDYRRNSYNYYIRTVRDAQ